MDYAVDSMVEEMELEKMGVREPTPTETVDQGTVRSILADWPEMARRAAHTMIHKYGQPNEATRSQLIWFRNGPWKRTIVYRREAPHKFPVPHPDMLEQTIDYHVPIDKVDDLIGFDGSVIVERTRGELSAACHMEEMNFLALNLAHDIITGKRTMDDARQSYGEMAMSFMMNKQVPYTEGLQFQPTADSRDTDQVTVSGPEVDQMSQQASSRMRKAA